MYCASARGSAVWSPAQWNAGSYWNAGWQISDGLVIGSHDRFGSNETAGESVALIAQCTFARLSLQSVCADRTLQVLAMRSEGSRSCRSLPLACQSWRGSPNLRLNIGGRQPSIRVTRVQDELEKADQNLASHNHLASCPSVRLATVPRRARPSFDEGLWRGQRIAAQVALKRRRMCSPSLKKVPAGTRHKDARCPPET